ncbi:MAG: hypothetical protein AAFX79_11710 [Planctomycetota bacterium]
MAGDARDSESQKVPADGARPKPSAQADPAIEKMRASLTQPGAPLRPHPKPLPTKPRRVSGGLRLKRKEDQPLETIPERRLMRLLELSASPAVIEEGLAYARGGQTRSLEVEPGRVRASVQGRRHRAYEITLELEPFTAEQWDDVADQLNEQPRIAADILAGGLPADVEEVFQPLGLALLPSSPDEVRVRTTCPDHPEDGSRWGKHACCVVALLGERIAADPIIAFKLRGLPDNDLAERMSHRRLVTAGGLLPKPIYQPRVEGASDTPGPTLEDAIEGFWDSPVDLDDLDLSVEPPAVPTPLLRRLGPSPFTDAKFPLVGLLATCYEVARSRLLREERGEDEDDAEPVKVEPDEDAAPRRPKTAAERAEALKAKMAAKAKARKK